MLHKHNHNGFTIVELLVVIVVIGILAAITIVAYNGIQQRALQARVLNNVQIVLQKAEVYKTIVGTYPSSGTAYTEASFDSSDTMTSLPSTIYAVYINNSDGVDYNSIVREGSLDPVAGYVIQPCTSSGYTGMRVFYPDVVTETVKSQTTGSC